MHRNSSQRMAVSESDHNSQRLILRGILQASRPWGLTQHPANPGCVHTDPRACPRISAATMAHVRHS